MIDVKKSWRDEAHSRLERKPEEFETWFDATNSVKETIANATIDFYHRIMTPQIYKWLGDPRGKVALEIGCGAGRLMQAAANVFDHVIGVDIHTPETFTKVSYLRNSVKNIEFVHRDNISVVKDASVDFVYSFVVFQHFDSVKEVEYYFTELQRVMKIGACGRIFFASAINSQVDMTNFEINRRAETLWMSYDDMAKIAKNAQMSVSSCLPAGPKKLWNLDGSLSSQSVITFVKK